MKEPPVNSQEPTPPAKSLDQQRTDLAFFRSRWAAERTLMAWIRTAIAMVTFGFAIDEFFVYLSRESSEGRVPVKYHLFGFLLVLTGIMLLVLALIEHVLVARSLKRQEVFDNRPLSLPVLGASIVLLIGVAALLLMIWRPGA
jgi:putative membrane protein